MQSLRVGVTAGRFSPKIRPNRFLGFSRGFHFLVTLTLPICNHGMECVCLAGPRKGVGDEGAPNGRSLTT